MGFRPDSQGGFRPDPQPAAAPSATPVTGTPTPTLADVGGGGLFTAIGEMPRQAAAQAIGGLSGLVGAALPGSEGQGARTSERVSSALTPPPVGNQEMGEKIVNLPGEVYNKLVTEPVGERGSSVPLIGAFGKGSAAVLPLLLGARAGMKPAKTLTTEQARAAAARDRGLRLTPEEMGSGPVAKTAASLAGEPRLAKLNTSKNQPLFVSRAKEQLGIPAKEELNLDSLKAARKEAHADYRAIRDVGDVPTDSTYAAEADAIGQQYRSAAKSFPGLAKNDVEKLTEGLKVPQFNASEAIDQIQILREQADEFFRKGETRLAKANRSAADMIEAQIGRHLEKTGRTELLTKYQAARSRIAQTYAVQKVVVGDDTINPQGLAKQLKADKPLTGNLREIAQQASDFERSTQKPTHQATGATAADALLALMNAIRSSGGSALLDLLSIAARPATRSFLASKLGQKMIDPRTNLRVPEAVGAGSVPQPQQEKR